MNLFKAAATITAVGLSLYGVRDSSRASSSASLDDKPVAGTAGVTTSALPALNSTPPTPGLRDVAEGPPLPGVAAVKAPELVMAVPPPATQKPVAAKKAAPVVQQTYSACGPGGCSTGVRRGLSGRRR